MIRKLLLAVMIGTAAATALAAAHAQDLRPAVNPANVTVIEKNQDFPYIGTPTYERCATEDCSDTQT